MINLGVVGCGRWGTNHIRVFNTLPESRVIAVADPDEERLEYVCAMYPGLHCKRDYRTIVNDPHIDAVVIATPVSTHFKIMRESLLAGKHVLCEKPLCQNSKQGEELVELVRTKGCTSMVGHVFLFNPSIVKLKELIDTGELGKLRYISSSRTNLGPIRSDVNVAYDLCSHDISIFNWLLGSGPEVASATGAAFVQPGVEDVVFVSMEYPDNVQASISASWLSPKKVRQITVVGSQKMATWDDLQLATPVTVYDKGATADPDYGNYEEFLRLAMWDKGVETPKVDFVEPLKVQATEFLKALQNGGTTLSDTMFGLRVVDDLEAIVSSIQRGGSPIRVSSRGE